MEHRKLHIARGEQVFGEFTADEIAAAVNEGRFFGTDKYWNESTNEWHPLSDLIRMEPASPARSPEPQARAVTVPGPKRTPFPLLSMAIIVVVCLAVGGYFLLPKPAKNTVIPKDVDKWDSTLKPAMERLSEEDRRLAAAYMVRAKIGEAFGAKNSMLDGITVGKAIDEEKKFEQEQAKQEAEAKALAAKVKAEKEALAAEIQETLTVALVNKGVSKGDFSENITAEFAYENKGTKDIEGFKGVAEFYNMFGDKIYSVNLAYEKGLPVGKSITWKGSMHYNQFMNEDQKFRDTPMEKLTFTFVPEMIVFSDGTRLSVKE